MKIVDENERFVKLFDIIDKIKTTKTSKESDT